MLQLVKTKPEVERKVYVTGWAFHFEATRWRAKHESGRYDTYITAPGSASANDLLRKLREHARQQRRIPGYLIPTSIRPEHPVGNGRAEAMDVRREAVFGYRNMARALHTTSKLEMLLVNSREFCVQCGGDIPIEILRWRANRIHSGIPSRTCVDCADEMQNGWEAIYYLAFTTVAVWLLDCFYGAA